MTTTATYSAAEEMLRQRLVDRGIMLGVTDDDALHSYLKGLNTVGGDHRSGWERRLQARLEEEMAA